MSNNKTHQMNHQPKESPGLRLEPDARRAHLLAIGASAFGARAYDEVQIDQVAELAGVSRGLLYHYFPGKQAFFAAIIQEGFSDILKATSPNPALPPEAQLRASLQAYVDFVEQNPHIYRALFRSAASALQSIQEVVNHNLDQQAKRILHALGPAAPNDPLLCLAVRAWLAFLIHAVLDWLDRSPKVDRQQLIDVCMTTLQSAVGASLSAAKTP